MPVIIRDKASGALIFDKSPTEKKIDELEARVQELESKPVKRTPVKKRKEVS